MAIITIDGPSGSGKGTVAFLLAQRLGWQLLDSGALYRLVALSATLQGVDMTNEDALVKIADNLEIDFIPQEQGHELTVLLAGENVSGKLRTEKTAANASKVAVLPKVRAALLQLQRSFAKDKNLIADGRDMGTVVFPTAGCKFYLTASAEERAKRRCKQLILKGDDVNMPAILQEIKQRDARDMRRKTAPLVPAADAIIIDNSGKSIDETMSELLTIVADEGFLF